MIHCIIIEDEPLATRKLTDYISQVPFLQLTACFDNGLTALEYLRNHPADLIFLDIQMKTLNGIHFLNALNNKPKIIFTTAYSTYAIDGYEHAVSDFLLKPFGFERFLKAVNKVADELVNQASDTEKGFVFIKTEYRMEKIYLKDILYVEGMKDYLGIVTDHGKIMTLLSFSKLQEILPSKRFLRVHKSWIVALEHIEHIERNRIKIGKALIPISESYKETFFSTLKNSGLLAI